LSRIAPLIAVAVLLGPAGGRARGSTGDGQIDWVLDEEQAFVESARTGKPVLVDAWAEWCTACKLMDRGTWTDPAVRREVARHFVPLRLDFTEEVPGSDPRKDAYGVQALPTVLSCRARGCPPSSARRATGLLKPKEMLAFLAAQR
jgi:thiol:disulfide interchange protein DsbD